MSPGLLIVGMGGLAMGIAALASSSSSRRAPLVPPTQPTTPTQPTQPTQVTTTPTGGATGTGPTNDPDDPENVPTGGGSTADADDPENVPTGGASTADADDPENVPTGGGSTGGASTADGLGLDQALPPRDLYGRPRTSGVPLTRYRAALTLDNLLSAGTYRGAGANRATIEAAQRDLGVTADGVIGPQTLSEVATALVSAPSPAEAPTITNDEQWRARTRARRYAYILDAYVAQHRTPTAAVVREAQTAMGSIAVDGRVGPETNQRVAYLLRGPLAAEDVAQRQKQIELYGQNGERAPQETA